MGHADPILEADARQNHWMPFSPNREFKQEPRMFVRGTNLNLRSTGDSSIMAPPFVSEKKHIDVIIEKLRKVLPTV